MRRRLASTAEPQLSGGELGGRGFEALRARKSIVSLSVSLKAEIQER